jgi:hypothetical protein
MISYKRESKRSNKLDHNSKEESDTDSNPDEARKKKLSEKNTVQHKKPTPAKRKNLTNNKDEDNSSEEEKSRDAMKEKSSSEEEATMPHNKQRIVRRDKKDKPVPIYNNGTGRVKRKPNKSSIEEHSKEPRLSKFMKQDFKFSVIEISSLEVWKTEDANNQYVRWFTKGKEIERIILAISFALLEEFKDKYNPKFTSTPPHEILSSTLSLAENELPTRKLPIEIIEFIDSIKTQYISDLMNSSNKYKDYIGSLLLNIIKKKCKINIKSSAKSIKDEEWEEIATAIEGNIAIVNKNALYGSDRKKRFNNTFGFIIEDTKVAIRYIDEQAKITEPLYNELKIEELRRELECKEKKISKQQKYIKTCEEFIEKLTDSLEVKKDIKEIFDRRDKCETVKLEELTEEAKCCFKSALSEYENRFAKKMKDCSICGRKGTLFELSCKHHSDRLCLLK